MLEHRSRRHALAVTALLGSLAASPAVHAQEPSSSRPLWELGAVGLGVTQQAYPGSDQQVNRALALPYFIYRGTVLRADRDTAGLRALKTERFEIDVGFAGSFGGGDDSIEAREGMRELGTQIELGPRLKWNLGPGPGGGRWRAEFPVRGVFDLSDGAAHRGVSFEPELVFERQTAGGLRYSASASAIFADTKLARTFYEVGAADATALRPAYAAKSGLVAWRLGASVQRSLSPDWRVFGFARVDSVAGAANESSPLVRQTTGASVGIGLSYTWMRSERRGSD
jgi:outer membrane scaffolding protein for murein synthesis (MipA/OmpV family)